MNEKIEFLDWLGLTKTPNFVKSRVLGGGVGLIVTLVAIVIVMLALLSLAGLMKSTLAFLSPDTTISNPSQAIRNIGLMFVALIGAPFVAWQAVVRQKQADIAASVLFNEKLNDANNDLHARYQKSEKQEDGTYVDIWEDDIIRRNGAIDRLEALANELPEIAPRISRILCVYLKEMTRDYPAEHPKVVIGLQPHQQLRCKYRVKRPDMENAAQVLGRILNIEGIDSDKVLIDLTAVNLQAMNLSGLNYANTNFERASLEKTKLQNTNLENSNLKGANLTEVFLTKTNLQGADLTRAYLFGTWFQKTILNNKTKLQNVNANFPVMREVDLSKLANIESLLDNAIGDASVILPEGVEKNDWPSSSKSQVYFISKYRQLTEDIYLDQLPTILHKPDS